MAIEFNGPVAFIDLLGFTNFVRQSDPSKLKYLIEKYAEAVERAMTYHTLPTGTGDSPLRLRYAVFSDSLVIYEHTSFSDRRQAQVHFERLIGCCSHLSYRLLELGQPFRGCIAQGDYCVQHDVEHRGIIVAGKPLLDAYDWEQRLQWIGIVMHPTVLTRYQPSDPPNRSTLDLFANNNEFRHRLMSHRWKKIPLRADKADKAETLESSLAILPVQRKEGPEYKFLCFAESLSNATEMLESLRRRAKDKDICRKYEATLEFYKAVQQERSQLPP